MKRRRKYHPYTLWEDYKFGMWRIVGRGPERDDLLQKAISFTGNAELYGSWMMKVIQYWPKSCEHNLTDTSINRRAWVGHAACCMAINCPEDITREAWGNLTEQQRIEANAMADLAISTWEHRASKKEDKQMVFSFDN